MQKDPERNEADEDRKPGVPPHQPPKDPDTAAVDEGSEESFPSSDPPSTGGPGI